MLLWNSHHPNVLRNTLDRDRLFDWLWPAVEHAEREDLCKGDVPIFTTRPGSQNLWASSNKCIANFLTKRA